RAFSTPNRKSTIGNRQSLHVPQVIAVRVHPTFGCQQVEGRELQVVEGVDRPAVASVGVDEAAGQLGSLAGSRQEIALQAPATIGPLQSREGIREAGAGGR